MTAGLRRGKICKGGDFCESIDSGSGTGNPDLALSVGKPKCTVDIGGGQCLIEYTIDLLHSRGIQDIGIVLGYEAQVIREVLADKGVSFFYNPFYDVTNSIASAWFAKEFLTGDDLLIMNGDVYLEEKLLDRILAQGRSPVMFADESRRETADYKSFMKMEF